MAGRKQLNGIALGLLGTFVSRNNDIDGYWGLGVLRLCALRNGLSELVLDLLKQNADSDVESPVQISEKAYQIWLFDGLAKIGSERQQLDKAEIHLEFSTFDILPNAIRDTRGDPYICTVKLTNKCGISYSATKIGVCAPHDPNKDRQSTRVK